MGFAINRLAGASRRKLRSAGNIGRLAQIALVTRYQHAVPGADQIRLDVVGAVEDRFRIRGQRVFGAQGASPSMAEHFGAGPPRRWRVRQGQRRHGAKDQPGASALDEMTARDGAARKVDWHAQKLAITVRKNWRGAIGKVL